MQNLSSDHRNVFISICKLQVCLSSFAIMYHTTMIVAILDQIIVFVKAEYLSPPNNGNNNGNSGGNNGRDENGNGGGSHDGSGNNGNNDENNNDNDGTDGNGNNDGGSSAGDGDGDGDGGGGSGGGSGGGDGGGSGNITYPSNHTNAVSNFTNITIDDDYFKQKSDDSVVSIGDQPSHVSNENDKKIPWYVIGIPMMAVAIIVGSLMALRKFKGSFKKTGVKKSRTHSIGNQPSNSNNDTNTTNIFQSNFYNPNFYGPKPSTKGRRTVGIRYTPTLFETLNRFHNSRKTRLTNLTNTPNNSEESVDSNSNHAYNQSMELDEEEIGNLNYNDGANCISNDSNGTDHNDEGVYHMEALTDNFRMTDEAGQNFAVSTEECSENSSIRNQNPFLLRWATNNRYTRIDQRANNIPPDDKFSKNQK